MSLPRPGRNVAGIGMTSQRTRARMVERLRSLGIGDSRVLHAMGLTLALRALAGFSGKPQPDKPEDKMVALRALGRVLAVATVAPGAALAVGWVVRGAM